MVNKPQTRVEVGAGHCDYYKRGLTWFLSDLLDGLVLLSHYNGYKSVRNKLKRGTWEFNLSLKLR